MMRWGRREGEAASESHGGEEKENGDELCGCVFL
jgi:hypothetical protein